MTEPNPHPGITFRITGYRSNGPAQGEWRTDHHLFAEGDFADVKTRFPIGSVHPHVPEPPCRYDVIAAGARDLAQERAQLTCPHCYRPSAPPVDNRRTS